MTLPISEREVLAMFAAIKSTGLADQPVAASMVENLSEAGRALRDAAREEVSACEALLAARERIERARAKVAEMVHGRFSQTEISDAAMEAGWWPKASGVRS